MRALVSSVRSFPLSLLFVFLKNSSFYLALQWIEFVKLVAHYCFWIRLRLFLVLFHSLYRVLISQLHPSISYFLLRNFAQYKVRWSHFLSFFYLFLESVLLFERCRHNAIGCYGILICGWIFTRVNECCIWGCMWIWPRIENVDYFGVQEFKKKLTVMAKEASNGDNHAASKPPPSPSPLRNSKFFQVMMVFLFPNFVVFISLFPGSETNIFLKVTTVAHMLHDLEMFSFSMTVQYENFGHWRSWIHWFSPCGQVDGKWKEWGKHL